MDNHPTSVLSFDGFTLEKCNFKRNSTFTEHSESISIASSLWRRVSLVDNGSEVSLGCKIFEDPEANNFPFYLEVVITGRFRLLGPIETASERAILADNTSAILFPFLRTFISNVTASGGYPPLVLPIFNVTKLPLRVFDHRSDGSRSKVEH